MADEMGRINGGHDYPDDEQLDRVLAEIDEIKRTIRSLPDGDRILAGGTTPTGGYGETYRPEPSVVSDPELRAAVDRLVRSVDELRRASGRVGQTFFGRNQPDKESDLQTFRQGRRFRRA